MHKKGVHMVTFTLLVIGGLNWLIFALFGTDVGAWLGGMDSVIAKIIYILVGLSAVYEVSTHGKRCKECRGEMMQSSSGMNPNMPR